MDTTKGKVELVKLRGPYKNKEGGEFNVLAITTGGVEYGRAQNGDDVPVEVGDDIEIVYKKSTYKDREGNSKESYKVVKLTKLGSSEENHEVKKEPVNRNTNNVSTSVPSNATAKDKSMARMNALTNAVALLKLRHDSGFLESVFNVEEVTKLAEELTNYTLEPYTLSK
jgi:hypothetical protein